MGHCCTHCHPGIATYLRIKLGLENFVETGTCHGESAEWASRHFQKVVTIEASATYAEEAASRLAKFTNARLLRGYSASLLATSPAWLDLKMPRDKTLYWLDAHWCGDNAAKGDEAHGGECPLLLELAAIVETAQLPYAIMIDDARLFTAPPPPPHDPKQWPDLSQIGSAISKANGGAGLEMRIHDDVIICAPRGSLLEYWRHT